MQQKSFSNWIDASCGNKADNYAFPLPQIIPLNILFQHPIQIQIYRQTSEIISSLLEYFSASAVYIRALPQIYKQTSEIISSLLECFSASAVYIRALPQIYRQTSEIISSYA